MVDRRDLLIELRDGEQCVEARFLRCTNRRFEVIDGASREGWLPFAESDDVQDRLVGAAADFRRRPSEAHVIELGTALWNSFAPEQRRKLQAFRANEMDPIERVSIRVAESAKEPFDKSSSRHSARDLWQSVAFECLLDPKDKQPDATSVQTFFLGADPNLDWALRRVLDTEQRTEHRRLPQAPIQVLLLLTSLHDPDDERRRNLLSSAREAISELQAHFARHDNIVLRVAGSRCDMQRKKDGRWCLPETELQVDLHYATDEELEQILSGQSLGPRHAVLFFGHSNATPTGDTRTDSLAQKLRFRLLREDMSTTVDVELGTLAAWLQGQPLEFVAALNCSSTGLAEHLLELAPDVIATSALVPGQAMAGFVRTFLSALLDDELLSTAFVRARQALPNAEHRPLVVQLSRTLDDVSFLGPNRRAVLSYHEKLQRRHKMLSLPGMLGRKAEFERVHVQLALSRTASDEGWATTREAFERGSVDEPISFEQLLTDPGDCWILRGVAGAGKTTTLRRCALESPEDRFVVYISLPIWLGAKGHPPGDPDDLRSVLDSIAAQLEVPSLADTIRVIAARGLGRRYDLRVTFLLDAFDELDPDQRDLALRSAQTLTRHLKRCPVVISSRETAEIADLGEDWKTARLLPLDDTRQLDLVTAWHEADAREHGKSSAPDEARRMATSALAQIHAGGPRMREFAGNPLLLTLLTNLQLDGQTRFDVGLHKVVETILDRLLRGEWLRTETKRAPKIADKDALRTLLRALSWSMLHQKEGSPRHLSDEQELLAWMGDSKAHPALAGAANLLKGRERMNCELRGIPAALADESPFCPEDPLRSRHWTFTHNLLQEALCAEHWWHVVLDAQDSDAAVVSAIRHLRARIGERPDALDFWTEPTAMLAGWMGNDRIVVELLRSKDTLDLGLRAMRAVDHLKPATVAQILELLPEWGYDRERANEGKKGPRVEAYEIIASQTRREDVAAMAAVLAKRAGVK